jgi:hypothetical protein
VLPNKHKGEKNQRKITAPNAEREKKKKEREMKNKKEKERKYIYLINMRVISKFMFDDYGSYCYFFWLKW